MTALNYLTKQKAFRTSGLISSIFLIFYSLFRFVLEFFRAPDPQIGYALFHLTMGQLVSIIFLFLGVYLYLSKKNVN